MSDFETVRRGLWWYPAPQRKVDAREALDRIEAEVERLRADQDGIDAELRAARAEVERLKWETWRKNEPPG